jgi:hypothetical protein
MTERAQNLGDFFFTVHKSDQLILTFWASFSQIHLVTLEEGRARG